MKTQQCVTLLKYQFKPIIAILCIGVISIQAQTLAYAAEIEVLHWWTSSSESAAAAQYRAALAERGYQWKDSAVGGNENLRMLLKSRIAKGTPPAAVMINSDLRQYAKDPSKLVDLSRIAQQDHWDQVLPQVVQQYLKMGGSNYVAVPTNVNRQNLMWISAPALKKIGVSEPPHTWDAFFAMADKAKQAGLLPIAAAETWTINLLFMQVALSTLGASDYKKAFHTLDQATLNSPGMVKAFELMRRIKSYSDRSAPTRKWNEATQMVIQNKAVVQIMGDWAKGEFLIAGLKPQQDFYCVPVPGTADGHFFNTDAFMLFKVQGLSGKAQDAFAETVMSRQAQEAFSLIKGSVPVRMDADMAKFDACSKQSHADMISGDKKGTLVLAPESIIATGKINAFRDVIQTFWADDRMTPQQAAEKMARAAKTS